MKIKLCYIIEVLALGGAEKLLLQLSKEFLNLQEPKFQIDLIVRYKGKLDDEFRKIGVNIHNLNLKKKTPLKSFIMLYKKLKEIKPDIVHTHLFWAERYGHIAAKLAGINYTIGTIHNMELKDNFGMAITRSITAIFASKIVTVSKSAGKYFSHIYPAKKLIPIYNPPAIDKEYLSRNIKTKTLSNIKTINLINVANIKKAKNQKTILKALKILHDKGINNICLYICGDGDMRKELEAYCKKSNLTNVFFLGQIDNVYKYLEKSHIYISSSIFEGLGIAVLEAITFGIVPILSDIPPYKEILEDIKNYKYFFDPNDSQTLANYIEELVENPDIFENISNNVKKIATKFDINNIVTQYINLYSRHP